MKIQKYQNNISFNSGLTSRMKSEILHCDVNKISNELTKSGIISDFKGNKVIAWCMFKSLQIINNLNKNYHLNLTLPRGIIVEDFNKLKISQKKAFGFCNVAPTKLYQEDIITPDKVIFFNSFGENTISGKNPVWDNIEEVASEHYEKSITTTDFFLEIFLHELSHSFHLGNMLKKMDGEEYIKRLKRSFSPKFLEKFHLKYDKLLTPICDYAATNPMEAIACDAAGKIVKTLDKNNLTPNADFIIKSPYTPKRTLNFFTKESPTDSILRKFWNGIFD